MPTKMDTDIQRAWNRFLQELELAKNYHMPYVLGGVGNTFRNPLLDYLLPSLLYIKMVAILDEALVLSIRNRGLTLPKKYRKSLCGRIEYLNDESLLRNYVPLHDICDLRNLLAHQASDTTTWDGLNADVDTVEDELQHLGLVGNRPDYEFFGERSAARDCHEPGIAFAQDFRFGVKCNDNVAMEFTFTRKIHNDAE